MPIDPRRRALATSRPSAIRARAPPPPAQSSPRPRRRPAADHPRSQSTRGSGFRHHRSVVGRPHEGRARCEMAHEHAGRAAQRMMVDPMGPACRTGSAGSVLLLRSLASKNLDLKADISGRGSASCCLAGRGREVSFARRCGGPDRCDAPAMSSTPSETILSPSTTSTTFRAQMAAPRSFPGSRSDWAAPAVDAVGTRLAEGSDAERNVWH